LLAFAGMLLASAAIPRDKPGAARPMKTSTKSDQTAAWALTAALIASALACAAVV
jgi:hypothetical protein